MLSTEGEGFVVSHLDCAVCHRDEDGDQWYPFQQVSVLLGIVAKVTVWGLTFSACEPSFFYHISCDVT
jgi:hypothetical protein